MKPEYSDIVDHANRHLSLAVVGMGCRLPGAGNIDEYWELLRTGKYAIREVPENRFSREMYYDSRKGVKGKSYMRFGGLVDYTPFDPRECRFPDRLIGMCDLGALEMCRVAAAACRDASLNPFNIRYPNTGVYIGSTVVGPLSNELVYAAMSPRLAGLLDEVPALRQALESSGKGNALSDIQSEAVHRIRQNGVLWPKKGFITPLVQSISTAVSDSLQLSGPSILLDAACSSSLNALAMARRDLVSGSVDMAIVGGGTYFTQENLILFSNAQSGSPDGSYPFSKRANGLIPAEGYVAVVVKTLERALADGDRVHALIHGIGLSSDGKGRSHWAPRIEGQVEAMRRAYSNPDDRKRLVYLEAHSTSTPVGDKTELDAIQTVFGDVFHEKRPIGSVKGNIGHPLEAAGVAGLIKAILVLKNNTIPPQPGAFPLSGDVAWDELPVYVPEKAGELPPSQDGQARLAAVSAFGVGGINAHVVIEEPVGLSRETSRRASASRSMQGRPHPSKKDAPIAVIGAGAVFSGARTLEALESLIRSGLDPKVDVPENRWRKEDFYSDSPEEREANPWKTGLCRGGFVTEFQYDWKFHKIPPKQIDTGNPLQFMILDAIDAAILNSGYVRSDKNESVKTLDSRRTSVVVGSPFGSDFITDLSLSFRFHPFQKLLREICAEYGITDPAELDRIADEFNKVFFRKITPLVDEAGGFTASSLASRITKVYDLMGGCVTLDAGSASGLAAIAQAVGMLREHESDLVLCAAGARSMFPISFIDRERHGIDPSKDNLPGEGAGAVVLKRLDDAIRDGDTIRCVLHGIGTGFDAEPEKAFEKAVRQAREFSGLTDERLSSLTRVEFSTAEQDELADETRVLRQAYPKAEFSNLARQIGDTQGASSLASLLKASMTSDGAAADENLAAVSAWDPSGIAYHLLLENVPSGKWSVASPTRPVAAEAPTDGESFEIVRLGAASTTELKERLASLSDPANNGKRLSILRKDRFGASDRYRLVFITDSEASLAEQIAFALENVDKEHGDKLLARKNIRFGVVEPGGPGKIAFLFSGQGSQYEGMLRPLVESSPTARKALREIDGTLRDAGLPEFGELAWSSRPELGVDVLWTQLSLFGADMLLFETAKRFGIVPDIVAGHSYGEFPAITASGAWTLRRGAMATKIRCGAITNCRNAAGKLLATPLGEAEAEVRCRELNARGIPAFIANANAPTQTILGVPEDSVQKAVDYLSEQKISVKILPVPRPFHTPIMREVRDPLYVALAEVPAKTVSTPLLSSVSNEFETEPERLRTNLAEQMTVPVRYVRLIHRLLEEGCTDLIECGPGSILTGLHQKIVAAYREQHPSAKLPRCLSLDLKGSGDVKTLLAVRAELEIAGHFDDVSTEAPVDDDADSTAFSWGQSHSEDIRRALRHQAGQAKVDNAEALTETMPVFLSEIARGAAVRPEPLFAYWKTHADDRTVLPEILSEKLPSTVEQPSDESFLDPISYEEYVRILRSYETIPGENARRRVSRFIPRLVDAPMIRPEVRKPPVAGRVLVLGDSPLGMTLARSLRQKGCEVVHLPLGNEEQAIRDRIVAEASKSPLVHCFVVPDTEEWNETHSAPAAFPDDWQPLRWVEARKKRISVPFAAMQTWYAELVKEKETFLKGTLYTTSFLDGAAGLSGKGSLRGGAIAGLAKMIYLESGLASEFSFRSVSVDFSPDVSPESAAELLIDEWTYGQPGVEIAYRGSQRRMVFSFPDFLSDETGETTYTRLKPSRPLSESQRPRGNWVVTGGARGITAYVARYLARQFGVKLHLLASSPASEVAAEWIDLDEAGKKELQRTVMIQARKDGKNAVAEWSRLEKALDLARSLRQFDTEKIPYVYHVCDVSDPAALEATLNEVRAQGGPISGILHGAGVDWSAAFQKKDLKNVEKTYAVKVDAAAALMCLTKDDPLRHFLTFGSSSGRMGSFGQTDYGLANDMLAKLVHAFTYRRPDCRSICFAWGAWDEIGMAVRPESKDSIAVKHFSKMTPAEGLRFIEEELGYDAPDREVLVTDWNMLSRWFVAACDIIPSAGGFSEKIAELNRDSANAGPTMRKAEAAPVAKPDAKPRTFPPLGPVERKMKRMLVRMVPVRESSPPTAFTFTGKALIYGDNPLARALQDELQRRSVSVTILPESEDEDAMEAYCRQSFAEELPLHLFNVSARSEDSLFDPVSNDDLIEHWRRRRLSGSEVPGVLLREWIKALHKHKAMDKATLAAVVSLGGNYAIDDTLGKESDGRFGRMSMEGATLPGYFKAIYHEHGGPKRDGLTVRVLDAPINEPVAAIARTLLAELASGDRADRIGIETALVDGRLYSPRLVDAEFTDAQQAAPQTDRITPGGVWIAVGGARGITAETVKALGSRYGLKFHLFGTQPLPEIDESLRYLSDEELEPYKQSVVKEALQKRVRPDSIWESFRKKLEIDRNLRRMRELGIEIEYHQCSIADAAKTKSLIDRIRAEDGPIRGVLQGAGIVGNTSMIRNTTPAIIQVAKDTVTLKMDASLALIEYLKDDPLEVFLAYGSVSGRFGAHSVSGYCAANEGLCKMMRFLRRRHPRCRAVGFHWHAWDEVGMTMRPISYGSIKVLKMTLLSPAEGTRRIIEELECGDNESEVVISDDQYYSHSFSPEMRYDASLEAEVSNAANRTIFSVADRVFEDRIESDWNPVTEPLIVDHRLVDKPILPAALMVESMIEAVLTRTETPLQDGETILLRNFEIAEGLRFFSDAPQTMRTTVQADADEFRCRILSTFANTKGVVLNPNRFHAGATLRRTGPGRAENLDAFVERLLAIVTPEKQGKILYVPKGSPMYHGPVLQELQWVANGGERVWGESIVQPIGRWTGSRPVRGWVTRPPSFDACLYLCGVAAWVFSDGSVGLPKGVAELRFFRAPGEAERCRIYAQKTGQSDSEIVFDFVQLGEDGRPVCLARSYRCQLLLGSKINLQQASNVQTPTGAATS